MHWKWTFVSMKPFDDMNTHGLLFGRSLQTVQT